MNEPVVPKSAFAISVSMVVALQTAAPAAIAVASLYVVIAAYDLPLLRNFHSMALVVALLSVVLLRPPRSVAGQLLGGSFPAVIAVIVRWLVVLAALLAV